MQKMAQFTKVSFEQFANDWVNTFPSVIDMVDKDYIKSHLRNIYDGIKMPKRATVGSAAYDFYAPMSFILEPGESITIPTGLRCEMYDGWVLMLYPRSGLGFKYGMSLANTVGVIDSDFCESDNEGHIHVKLTNDSCLAKEINIKSGTAFCQGMFTQFGIALDDDAVDKRNGGWGSTGM